jgi:hypothetical protein
MSVRHALGCLALLTMLTWLVRAYAEEKYFFAILSCPEKAKGTHTFALLIKTSAGDETEGKVEVQTISWTGRKEASPHDSVKLDKSITEVLERARNLGVRCTMLGPYPIQQSFYDHVLGQAVGNPLGLAGIRNETDGSPSSMANYLHAVANVSEDDGDSKATREANRLLVLRGLEPWLLPPGEAPDWLRERLELKKYDAQK